MARINKNQTQFESSLNKLDTVITSQSGNAGKFITTDGTNLSWAEVKGSSDLVFTNVSASNWIVDTTYFDYGYRCELTCADVTSSMTANVYFADTEANSNNYAPICKTDTNKVIIYSVVNTNITIPKIIVK